MEIVFFKCAPKDAHNFNFIVYPDNGDVLPLEVIPNSKDIYHDDEKVILECIIDDDALSAITLLTGLEDPFSLEAVQDLGIQNEYIGRTIDDVYARYPELKDPIDTGTVDEAGNPIYKVQIPRHTWAK